MRRFLQSRGFALCIGFAVAGCENAAPPGSEVQACASVGQRCQFAPGKLGACVQRDDCDPERDPKRCFVCQSQH